MKVSGLFSALALTGAALAVPQRRTNCTYPTTLIAGVEVIDTPLVRDARAIIEKFIPLQPYLYYHSMRTWLWGSAAFNNNATLKSQIDLEVHAVGALLHDLGWDMNPDSPWVSPDRRFEVDGGVGAMEFIKSHPDAQGKWDEVRLEKVYDGIALQATPGVIAYKNLQVQWIVQSVGFEFPGPRSPLIRNEDYDNVLAEFPNDTLFRGTNETFTWLCASKPEASYNTFISPFGEAFVPGYNETGHRLFDIIQAGLAAELEANT